MGSATRGALADTRAALAELGGADLQVAEDLLAVGRIAGSSSQLRSALVDAEADAAQKRTLVESVFGGLDGVLNEMIEGAAFEELAGELGFGASKRLVDGRIADLPVFAGVSGTFDQTQFERFLRENGMTETQLRREIRQQLLAEQIAGPIASMPALSPGIAQPYAALLMERRRGVVSRRTLFDASTPVLPGFAKFAGFVF